MPSVGRRKFGGCLSMLCTEHIVSPKYEIYTFACIMTGIQRLTVANIQDKTPFQVDMFTYSTKEKPCIIRPEGGQVRSFSAFGRYRKKGAMFYKT